MIERLRGYASRARDGARWLWANHIQKSCAGILAAATAFDLAGYHDSVAAFTGEKGYHAIRLALAGIILLRASRVRHDA